MRVMWMRVGAALAVVLGGVAVGSVGAGAVAEAPVELRVSDHTSVLSEAVTLTVTVPRTLATRPTGTVDLVLDGTTTVGTVKLRATAVPRDTAVLRTRSLPIGEHTIVAVYSGDRRYPSTTSRPVEVRVRRADTTTTLRSLLADVATGTTARFVARVAPVAPATGVPTGTVTFKTGAVTRTVPVVDGSATWRPRLPDGPHRVFAVFEGGDSWGLSESPRIDQRVGPVPVPEVDQAVTSTSGETLLIVPAGTFPAAAQVFTAGVTGTLTAVDLDHLCLGGMGGPGSGSSLVISIKALSGDTPTGAILGSGVAAGGPDPTTGLTRIDLTTPAPVTAGTRYAVVVPAPQGSFGCELGLATEGQSMVLSGSVWSSMGHPSLRFRTWVRRP